MGFSTNRVVLLTVAALGSVTSPAWAQRCDEHCLKAVMGEYLEQLAKHDPGPVPVSPQINARENTAPVKLGQGSWQTISTVLPGLEFADPLYGEIVYAGGVRRAGTLSPMFLRLRVVQGKITESEMLTTGPGVTMPQGNTSNLAPSQETSAFLTPDILYDAPVPKDRRSTRKGLTQIPYLYAEGLAKGDGSIPPFGPRCDRWQAGGRKISNNPAGRGGAVPCAKTEDRPKGSAEVTVANRRVVVVDVPRGIAVGMFIVVRGEGQQKTAHVAAEIFKVVDGKIRSVEEYGAFGQYPPDSGFSGPGPAPPAD